jgi:catechol 2,3-dioxygenase-like lactoylglutathione lyase family enzyme
MTVADLDRSIDFYTTVLNFRVISDRFDGLTDARVRVVTLELGKETIELTQFLTPTGKPIPPDSRSHDRWFQHIAIVVADMERAYQQLSAHSIELVSPSPQTLPAWNPVAGGIQAFYFRDPDGHNLELIYFPPSKGDPKWQQHDALFLGIDHTAIVVADTDASRAFYCDRLGLELARESENFGTAQELLSGLAGVKVRISSLKAPAGIGIELLEYLQPHDGRSIPPDTRPNDLWYCQTTIAVADAIATCEQIQTPQLPLLSSEAIITSKSSPANNSSLLIADPDRHVIRLVDLWKKATVNHY